MVHYNQLKPFHGEDSAQNELPESAPQTDDQVKPETQQNTVINVEELNDHEENNEDDLIDQQEQEAVHGPCRQRRPPASGLRTRVLTWDMFIDKGG